MIDSGLDGWGGGVRVGVTGGGEAAARDVCHAQRILPGLEKPSALSTRGKTFCFHSMAEKFIAHMLVTRNIPLLRGREGERERGREKNREGDREKKRDRDEERGRERQ